MQWRRFIRGVIAMIAFGLAGCDLTQVGASPRTAATAIAPSGSSSGQRSTIYAQSVLIPTVKDALT